jgi:hypothetical protein
MICICEQEMNKARLSSALAFRAIAAVLTRSACIQITDTAVPGRRGSVQ